MGKRHHVLILFILLHPLIKLKASLTPFYEQQNMARENVNNKQHESKLICLIVRKHFRDIFIIFAVLIWT